jgi:hypothetical protein
MDLSRGLGDVYKRQLLRWIRSAKLFPFWGLLTPLGPRDLSRQPKGE